MSTPKIPWDEYLLICCHRVERALALLDDELPRGFTRDEVLEEFWKDVLPKHRELVKGYAAEREAVKEDTLRREMGL